MTDEHKAQRPSTSPILITGGCGFIGSALVRLLINETDQHVVNVDKLTYAGNPESLGEAGRSPRYTHEQVDICDKPALQRVFREYQPSAVVHLAAESHVDRSIQGPGEFIQTNVVGTYNLLEAAREYWQTLNDARKDAFRFHHVSTDEVYGDLPHPNDTMTPSPSTGEGRGEGEEQPPKLPKFEETTPYNPSSPYSASKASSDHLVGAWHRTYGLPVLITNCSNNYGPYQFPEKLIPLMILNALDGKPLPVYGKGENIRDWLYVEDHADALYQVLTRGQPGRTYNIGGRCERTNLDVVHAICDALDELAPNPPLPTAGEGPGERGKNMPTSSNSLRTAPATTGATPSMTAVLPKNLDGNRRKAWKQASRKPSSGTWATRNGWNTYARVNTVNGWMQTMPTGKLTVSRKGIAQTAAFR